MLSRTSLATNRTHRFPRRSSRTDVAQTATLPIDATCEPLPCGLQRAETPTEAAGASIPPHLIPTVRNNQLPTAELAELLNASPAEIDAIRALGPYCGEGEGWAGVVA